MKVLINAVLELTIDDEGVTALKIVPHPHVFSVIDDNGYGVWPPDDVMAHVKDSVESSSWPVLRQPLPDGITWEG